MPGESAYTREEQELLRKARAYATIMPPHQFFIGNTAELIYGLPVLRYSGGPGPADLEVGALHPHRAPRRPGVCARQFRPALVGVRMLKGLQVIDVASFWATHGPRLAFPDRVALGDAIIRTPRVGGQRPVPWAPAFAGIDELQDAALVRQRAGRAALLEAIPHLRDGVASVPETHLRLCMVDVGLPEPELDYDVYAPNGRYLGTSELALPELRFAIEYEGDHHRTRTRQWNRDIEKYQDYRAAGWDVFRVTADALYRRRAELVRRLSDALRACGWSG